MKIIFTCVTNYTIFTAYILSKTIYEHDYKILIVNNVLIKEDIVSKLKKINVWDEVVYVEEDSSSLEGYLHNSKDDEIDILHFFSLGCGLTTYKLLTYYFNYNVKFILTEEGGASWIGDTALIESLQKINVDNVYQFIMRINEVWLFDKRMYMGNVIRNVKNIEVQEYLSDVLFRKELLKDLNYVFDYKEEYLDFDVLYFDANFSQAQIMSRVDETIILEDIIDRCKKIMIKPHPNDHIFKYSNINKANLIKNIDCPWELVVLNQDEKSWNNKVYINYCSTAVFNMMLLNKNCKATFIFTYKLDLGVFFSGGIEKYVYVDRIVEKFKLIFTTCSIFIPKSFEELNAILEKVKCNNTKYLPKERLYKSGDIINKFIEKNDKKLNLDSKCLFFLMRQLYFIKDKFNNRNVRYIIWGTGSSSHITQQMITRSTENLQLVGYIDKFNNGQMNGVDILKPEGLSYLDYDIIFICTSIGKTEVEDYLQSINLKLAKDYFYGYGVS